MGGTDASGLKRRVVMGAAAAAVLVPAAAVADAGKIATMKFALRGNQPLTTLFVRGKGPYLMLVDTGNGLPCLLRKDLIDKLDLDKLGETRVYGATGTDTTFGYMAHDVIIGNAAREPDLIIVEWPGAGPSSRGAVDGVLAATFFSNHPTNIDFTKGEIQVYVSGTVDRTGFRPVRCEHADTRSGTLVVQAKVDGIPARLVVDTGCTDGVALHPKFVAEHGLWDRSPHYLETQFGGLTKDMGRARIVRTPSVQLGPYKFQDPLISLSDPHRAIALDTDGLLGIELLRRFTVGFDHPGSTLWLKPNDALADTFAYDHSGLTWEWTGGGAVVRSAAPGSPAQTVGLKPGDKIIGLATENEAYAWDRRLSGPPETVINIEVMRGSERIPIKMVLKDWL